MKQLITRWAGPLLLFLVVSLSTLVMLPQGRAYAQQVADQVILSMKFIKGGVQSQGGGVLQVGEVNTLSASVASATLTEVVAAPSSGSVYVRGLLIEKSTGAGGTVTLKYGTGTNCGTGTTTILGPITNPPIGYIPLGILAPSAKALCVQTDAATTLVRALTN